MGQTSSQEASKQEEKPDRVKQAQLQYEQSRSQDLFPGLGAGREKALGTRLQYEFSAVVYASFDPDYLYYTS